MEPDEKSYNIDPNRILQAITKKTKAILPVHLYGQAADLDPILEIANRFQLFVIEDAAQAHGAKYKGKLIGSHGHCSAWSFYPTKNLGAFGDAGAITTNDKKIAETLRLYRNYGSRSRNKHEVLGYNSRLDPVQAAILRVKLLHLDYWNSRRKEIASTYLSEIQNDIITLPHFHKDQEHAWHIFAIRLKEREKLQQFLAKNGVDTLSHYPIPPFKQKAYENLSVANQDYSITSKISNEILSLPIGPHLETSDQEYIVDVLNSFY